MQSIRCGVVGDTSVGKCSMLEMYANNKFPQEWVPTVVDKYDVQVTIDGVTYTLCLYNVAEQTEYDVLREIVYVGTEVFIMCFSIVSPSSLDSLKQKWIPEAIKICPTAHILLVGTQVDLRNDVIKVEELAKNKQKPLSPNDGQKAARDLKAVKYLECSSLTTEGLKNVFDTAVLIATAKDSSKEDKSDRCIIV